jgi:undecaprenyl-diphosphatase
MNILHALILGLVEGFTEFLPVSSTAHLILTSHILDLEQSEFLKSFEVIIQVSAILAVISLYWRSLLNWEVLKRLALAFIPTGLLGLLLYDFVKNYLFESTQLILWSLIIGGLVLILFEKTYKEPQGKTASLDEIPYSTCLMLGLFQSLAMIPGVSRSGATIVGGLALGLQKKTIVEFSFLLAIPTILAASVLDLYKNAQSFTANESLLLSVGFISSFFMALISIKFLLSTLQKNTFTTFGLYRIAIAALFMLAFS